MHYVLTSPWELYKLWMLEIEFYNQIQIFDLNNEKFKFFEKLYKTLKHKEKYSWEKDISSLFTVLEANVLKQEQTNFATTLKQSTYMIENMQNMDDFFIKLDFMDRQIADIQHTSSYQINHL